MTANDVRYDYNRFGSKGKRVGQAVHDIVSKSQPTYTAGDILDAYADKFTADLEKAVQDNKQKFKSPFYILVLTHKEMWAENVVRNWFVSRQTAPAALTLVTDYPHHMKTLYMFDTDRGLHKLIWSIPGLEDCKTIIKRKDLYDPQLVKWVEECFAGKLEKEAYSFD